MRQLFLDISLSCSLEDSSPSYTGHVDIDQANVSRCACHQQGALLCFVAVFVTYDSAQFCCARVEDASGGSVCDGPEEVDGDQDAGFGR